MSIYGNFINEKSKLLNYNNGKDDDRETTVMSKKEHEEYIKKLLSRQRNSNKENLHPGIAIYDKKYNNSTETDDIE